MSRMGICMQHCMVRHILAQEGGGKVTGVGGCLLEYACLFVLYCSCVCSMSLETR